MKLSAYFLFSYLTVFHTVFVKSGTIFDVTNTRQKIGCGVQKFGSVIEDNCGNNGDQQNNTVESHEERQEKRKFLYLGYLEVKIFL